MLAGHQWVEERATKTRSPCKINRKFWNNSCVQVNFGQREQNEEWKRCSVWEQYVYDAFRSCRDSKCSNNRKLCSEFSIISYMRSAHWPMVEWSMCQLSDCFVDKGQENQKQNSVLERPQRSKSNNEKWLHQLKYTQWTTWYSRAVFTLFSFYWDKVICYLDVFQVLSLCLFDYLLAIWWDL